MFCNLVHLLKAANKLAYATIRIFKYVRMLMQPERFKVMSLILLYYSVISSTHYKLRIYKDYHNYEESFAKVYNIV